MRAVLRTLTRCLVCASTEVRTDEVIDRGVVFLAECGRCASRWTSSEPIQPIVARIAPEPQAAELTPAA